MFALSIPIAYLDADRALLVWLLIFPLEWVIGRSSRPNDAGAGTLAGTGLSGREWRRQSLSAASSATITGSGIGSDSQRPGSWWAADQSAASSGSPAMRMRSPPSSVWRR